MLQAEHLRKQFGSKVVVKDINLRIGTGDLVAFLGPNGAGKSTTINMLTGIITPTSGEVTINHLKPKDRHFHQQLGVVFQESVLDDELTVKENLLNRQAMYHDIQRSLDYWIEKFQLQNFLDQKYQTLSGGQKRRVDIVRALIHEPKILFLDEPTTGLDIQTRNLIWKILNQLRQEQQLTVVLTTHYLEEAEIADFVYVIDHGQVIAADTVNQLKQQYAQNTLTLYPNDMAKVQTILQNYSTHPVTDGLTLQVPEPIAIQLLEKLTPVINDFEYRRGNMDDIFVNLTGEEAE